jgi:hypothetical protein
MINLDDVIAFRAKQIFANISCSGISIDFDTVEITSIHSRLILPGV